MPAPLVSVIVTTYNREEYLKRTILSILNQTYKDFELIVVDNYSNYDFNKLIASFEDVRIKPYQNANNGVIAVNRNFGISKARGKYLAFCDDDDMWEVDKLEKQLSFISHNPNYIVATSCSLIDDNDISFKTVIRTKQYSNKYNLYKGSKISLSSVLIENSKLVIFDENPLFVGVEDWCLWLKLIHEGYSIHILQEPLLKYRFASSNYSKNKKFRPIKQIACLSTIVLRYPNFHKFKYLQAVLINLMYYCYYMVSQSQR